MTRVMLHPSVLLILAMTGVSVYAQTPDLRDAAVDADTDSLMERQFYIIVTTAAGFLTMFVTQIVAMWKERQRRDEEREKAERQRQWDVEDRRMAREAADLKLVQQTAELTRIAQLEADLTRARAAQVEAELKIASVRQTEALKASEDKIVRHIEHNTEVSQHAFKEANDINRKIASITATLDGVRSAQGARRATDVINAASLAQIKSTVNETQRVISDDAKPVIDETLERVRHLDPTADDGGPGGQPQR